VTTSGNGWCKGGTSQASDFDQGGGFFFTNRNNITSDGTYLYITDWTNSRISRFLIATPTPNTVPNFQGGASTRGDQYTNTWTTTATTLSGWRNNGYRPRGVWTDGSNLYVVTRVDNYTNATNVEKINLSTGNVVGWKGLVLTGTGSPSPLTCTTDPDNGTTSTWCTGGVANYGLTLGGFYEANYVTGDDHYIYVSDENTHRLTRVTK